MLINNRFLLKDLLGQGSYGQVFSALDQSLQKTVALKIQIKKSSSLSFHREIKTLEVLSGTKGFPKLLKSGTHNDLHFIVMPRYKSSLQETFEKRSKKLTIEEVAFLGYKLLKIIQKFHSFGFVHRDLKPQNILVQNKRLVLIDFGACSKYVDQNRFHIKLESGLGFVGNLAYSSKNAHFGRSLSRRDDLESICYILAYLIKGDLPWSRHFFYENTEEKIGQSKLTVKAEALFGTQEAFLEIFAHVKSLRFDEHPDYDFMTRTLKNLCLRKGFKLQLFRLEHPRGKSQKYVESKKKNHFKDNYLETLVASNMPEFKDKRNFVKKSLMAMMSTRVL